LLILDDAKSLEVLRALVDENSRKILLAIASKSLCVQEICLEEHLSISTCYRKIHDLETKGIVMNDGAIITDEGKKAFRYSSNLKNAMISFNSGKITIEVRLNERISLGPMVTPPKKKFRNYE